LAFSTSRAAYATASDDDDLREFTCWDGDTSQPWVQEVEFYVRFQALKRARRTVLFRGRGKALVAVSAFDARRVKYPVLGHQWWDGWQLQVVAIRLRDQGTCLADGTRISDYVLSKTYQLMREEDPERRYVTARVHEKNKRSITAADRLDLAPAMPDPEHPGYWIMLGPTDT
jgi:hypothetical protein